MDVGNIDYIGVGHINFPAAIVRKKGDFVPTGAYDNVFSNIVVSSINQTGAPLIYLVKKNVDDTVNTGALSIADQLHEIKNKFGLNLSQLSKILNVSRPQLYKWMESDAVPQREEFNQKIAEMYSLLGEIPVEHSKYFGKLANRYTDSGATVMDFMIGAGFDKTKLLSLYESIRNDIESIESRKAEEISKYHKRDASEVLLPPNDLSS